MKKYFAKYLPVKLDREPEKGEMVINNLQPGTRPFILDIVDLILML